MTLSSSAHILSDHVDLTWSETVARNTAHLYERVSKVIPEIEWPFYAPYVHEINRLKQEKNAVILAHNYQTAEIYNCVADYVGDSLQLARLASETDADIIIQGGVHFMAETSKLMNPDKTVLIPDGRAGCSLAESITADDVRKLKQTYPGVPVVTYVNTSAEVKAESDICCTSSNAVAIVESLKAPRVLVIPDQYLANYVARFVSCEVIPWQGRCEVHERFNRSEVKALREAWPEARVLAHPECPPEVINEADFTGSTSSMVTWIKDHKPERAILLTECSMADNVEVEAPETSFVRPCNLCPHMKRITLPKILKSLLTLEEAITIDPNIAKDARRAVDRMINAI